ncbi:MAG: hypothetical protein EOO22_13715 [Comamonadaceae bacterium]|nr:MAG: hypothetical protein EOO22_13715 [Comamonadaceae bacterium]
MSTSQSSAIPVGLAADFVTGDMTALAQHMRDCARAHGRMSAVKGGLQRMHSVAAGRIVTLGLAAVVIGLGVVALA